MRFLGFVADGEFQAILRNAVGLVFPSLYEGFGLPALEAAQARARIVTSRLEVFDEIGVPPQAQVDFADPDALLAALRRPGPTVLLRAPLTWRDAAERTLAVLRRAARA